MKKMLIATALLLGTQAMAQGEKAAAPAAPAAKISKKEAKEQCLKENKDLKGAKLHECIKGKMK